MQAKSVCPRGALQAEVSVPGGSQAKCVCPVVGLITSARLSSMGEGGGSGTLIWNSRMRNIERECVHASKRSIIRYVLLGLL